MIILKKADYYPPFYFAFLRGTVLKYINKITNKNINPTLAFLLTFVTGTLIFYLRDIVTFGRFMFMHSDMQNQMMPVLYMFIRQLFEKHNILYSFDAGLGTGTIPLYTNGGCFSFFNIILLLPFSINLKAFLLVIIKLSFGSFCFCALSDYVLKKHSVYSLLLAVMYSLGSFNMAYYFVTIWQDGIYMLPIIILGILLLLDGKSPTWIIIAYSYLFVCNFYSGYIIGIYSFLLFFLLLCLNNNRFQILLRYCLYVVTSIFLSAVVLLPTAYYLLNNDASESTTFPDIVVNIFDYIRQFYMGQYYFDQSAGVMPYIYCGLLPLMGIILFFITKSIDKKYKYVFGLMLILLSICTIFKPGYILMHAFNNPDNFGNRFAFLISFTILIMCIYVINFIEKIEKKHLIVSSFGCIAYIVLYNIFLYRFSKLDIKVNSFMTILNVIIILIYMLLFVYKMDRKLIGKAVIICTVLIEICVNGLYMSNTLDRSITEYKDTFNYCYIEENEFVDNLGNNYTRIIIPETVTFNNSQLLGYRSLGIFSSFVDTNLRKTMRHLGYAVSDLEIKTMGYTDPSIMILGVDNVIHTSTNDTRINEAYMEDKKSLSIAYMSNDAIVDVELGNNPFDNINNVLSSLTGNKIEYFYNTGNNVVINCNNIKYAEDIVDGEEVILFTIDDFNNESGYIEFSDNTSSSVYFYPEMMESYTFYDSPVIYGKKEGYRDTFDLSILTTPHIVEMSQTEEGTKGYIIIDPETVRGYYFKKLYFYGTNESTLDDVYNDLSQNEMDIENFKDGYLAGYVNSTENNNILFTTIPYDDNWNVYLDGMKAEKIGLIDNTFLGIVVPEGRHYVKMKYVDKWTNYGLVISSLGFALMTALFVLEHRKRKVIN